ncbi:MAG: photosynthetic complex putative assembly protein PuhB [Pseudomonadota bacterium]
MRDDDFAFEPTPGLPEALPGGEVKLWSGAPDPWRFGHRIFPTKWVAAIFAIIAVSSIFSGLNHGAGAGQIAFVFFTMLAVGAAIIGFAVLAGWLVAINTIYTITSERVIIRHGVVMPMAVNVPFSKVAIAACKARGDGSGDLSLALLDKERISFFALWPHNRPWSWQGTVPAMRGIHDVNDVAKILSDALGSHARLHEAAHVLSPPKVVRTRPLHAGAGHRARPDIAQPDIARPDIEGASPA